MRDLVIIIFILFAFIASFTVVNKMEEKKKLYFFTTNNCVYCEKMKKEVFPKVKDDLEKFDFQEINNSDLADKYDVESFPTFIILDGAKELRRHVGYADVETFKKWLNE